MTEPESHRLNLSATERAACIACVSRCLDAAAPEFTFLNLTLDGELIHITRVNPDVQH